MRSAFIPPLWVNFKKSDVKGTLFHKQDKLKLVVHCGDSIRYEQALVREYLAYRIPQSPHSGEFPGAAIACPVCRQ